MANRPTADQLVQAAAQGIESTLHTPREDWTPQGRAAVVAVLRELAGHLGPNDRPDHGCYWSPDGLRELADQIDQENTRG